MTKNAIDDIDMKILAVLKAEGRISNLELAERIGLSATPVQPTGKTSGR